MLGIASLQQISYFVEYSNKFQLSQLSLQPQLNNLDHLDDLRISPRPAAIAITEELSSPALGGTASKRSNSSHNFNSVTTLFPTAPSEQPFRRLSYFTD
jgi:hypothetical protein